jgi:hypothetical protein
MTMHQFSSQLVDREVERLFKENPPVYGKYCRNPVTGDTYIGGLDPTRPQKEAARRALRAREWFKFNGPADAQPFPISHDEREALKGTELLRHIVKWYARSLDSLNYDFNQHPPFADYVSGVLWEAELPVGGFVHLPNYPSEQLVELKKRFPPRMLKGMSQGATWLPPKKHREAMASLRRSSHNAEVYFNRE